MVRQHHQLNGHEFAQTLLWEIMKDREPGVMPSTGLQRVGHDLVTEQQYYFKRPMF